MLEMVLCRGISASGKSTYAKVWAASAENRLRVSRDDIRMVTFGKWHGVDENIVTAIEDATITAALKAGWSVIVDDTNITERYVWRLAAIGHRFGARVTVKEFDVDLEEAIRRNAARAAAGGNDVPEDVIRKQYKRLKSSKFELRLPEYTPHSYSPDKDDCILVDVDGTLAMMGDRSPYDWKRVGEDSVVEHVAEIVNALAVDNTVIIMSGRDGVCYPETTQWLDKYIVYDEIHMRAAGDMRPDSIVKYELFDEFVRPRFNVKFVLDDRQQVVDMWRALGIPCLQVAEGNF